MGTEHVKMKPGTVFCVLCQGVVSYKKGESRRFNDHMNIEHGAYHNLRYILAGCLMNIEERNVVAEIIEEREQATGTPSTSGRTTSGMIKNHAELSLLDKAFPLAKVSQDDSLSELALTNVASSSESPPEQTTSCTLCDATLKNRASWRKHLVNVHKLSKEEREVVYDYLRKPTENKEEIEQTEDPSLFKCNLCEYSTNKESSLKIHKTMKHKENEMVHIKKENLDIQDIQTSLSVVDSRKNLNVDEDSFEDDDVAEYKCNLCEYSASQARYLKIHKTMKHQVTEQKKSPSKLIDKSQHKSNENDLMQKEKIEKSAFNCDLCDYSTTKESSLKIHKTMKHKGNEKLEDKMLISKSLFKKKGNNEEATEDHLKCSKCDYSSSDEKEMKYHRFRNHRIALIKKSVTALDEQSLVEDKEGELVEYDPLDIADVSVDFNDSVTSADEIDSTQDSSMLGKKLDIKEEFLKKSEYFQSRPANIMCWTGMEEDLLPDESLPEGWGVKHQKSTAGRKYQNYVTPDRVFKLRSLVAILEYMKSSDEYSQADIRSFELKIKAKLFSLKSKSK